MQLGFSKVEYVVRTHCFGVHTLLEHMCNIIDIHLKQLIPFNAHQQLKNT